MYEPDSDDISHHGHSSRKTCSVRGPNLDWTRDPPPSTLSDFQRTIRNVDWSKTSIGSIETWPRQLRQAVLFMLAETDPAILYVGDDHVIIYNEAYVPLIGINHPNQLGTKAVEAFPIFWPYFASVIEEQKRTGATQSGENRMLLFLRQGFVEETYFTWKMTPVIGDDGQVFATYGRPKEMSNQVLSSRRMACVESLTQQLPKAKDVEDMWAIAKSCMSTNDKDIPLAILYTLSQNPTSDESPKHAESRCQLRGTIGVPQDHALGKEQITLQGNSKGFAQAILKAQSTHEPVLVEADATCLTGLLDGLEWQGFKTPSQQFVVLPINVNGAVVACLVLGINPHLRLDEPYRRFVQVVSDIFASGIADLRLSEEVKRSTEAAELASLKHARSELKFSRFAERSFIGLCYTDMEGKILYANDAWRQFTGLEGADIDMQQWLTCIHEDDLAAVKDVWYDVVELKRHRTIRLRSKVPFEKGQLKSPNRTAMVAAYPDLDDDGNVSTIMSLILDISEQVWAEHELSARQEDVEREATKFRNFAEKSPHGVVRSGPDGVIQWANDAWHKFYEIGPDQLKDAHPWLHQIDEEDHPAILEYFGRVRTSSSPTSLEFRKRHKIQNPKHTEESDGYLWLLATGWTEFRDDGSADHVMFWITDITEQKAAAKILENKMEEAVRLKTQQERFIDMISHEIRNPLSAVLHCGEEIVDIAKKVLIGLDSLSISGKHSLEESIFSSSIRSQLDGALEAANTIMYCVQHQKQIVDDVLTLSKLDSDLLVVSPIPVQPVELVRSALKIFEPELKSADIKLDVFTNDLEAATEANWILLDPNRFLQIVINLITNAIKFTRNSKVRRITVEVSARTDKPLGTDDSGVQMVPRRRVSRQSSTARMGNGPEAKPTENVYLCLSVSDTGKGLSQSERVLLFQRFAQASPKTHVEYGGSGLGLFISRQITEMLGGEIGVGSNAEGGATFTFWVAARKTSPPRRASLGVESVSMYTKTLVTPTPNTWIGAPEQEVIAERKPETNNTRPAMPTPEPTTTKRRVLVVEDNLINQKVLCKQLRNRGFVVEAANHGQEALAALEKNYACKATDGGTKTFDCVLCDIEMPIMDGIECVTEIRRLENARHFPGHVPIIGVTANVRSKQVNAAVEAGMDGVTTKPYRIDELIAHIDRVCLDTKTFRFPNRSGTTSGTAAAA